MTEKRFEIDSRMYGATDIRYYLKDNANELVDGYGDKIYWGDGSSNGLKQIVNKLNELYEEKEELKRENEVLKMEIAELRESEEDNKTITYKELDKIIIEVTEGYMNMLRAGHMSFSEFVIIENLLLKINERLNQKTKE